MPKILYMMKCLIKQTENQKMEITLLTALYEELLKLFIHFGAATKLDFGDMVDKTARIRNN